MARRIRETHSDMSIADFKALVREQFNILLIDQEAALAAIPSMLPPDAQTREKAYGMINQLMNARGEPTAEDKKRMSEIARLFGLGSSAPTPSRGRKETAGKSILIRSGLRDSAHEPESPSPYACFRRPCFCCWSIRNLLPPIRPALILPYRLLRSSCRPPKHDSAQTRAELQELLRLQESRTSQQVEHVKGDDHRTVERFLGGMNIKVGTVVGGSQFISLTALGPRWKQPCGTPRQHLSERDLTDCTRVNCAP